MAIEVTEEEGLLTPKVRKVISQVLIGFIILFFVILIWKNRYLISKAFETKAPNVGAAEQLATPVLETRKPVIQSIGQDLKTDIYSTGWSGHDYDPYNKALSLPDNELKYLAVYYKQNLSSPLGRSLWDDIDTQWYWWSDAPERLQNKLSTVGEK